VRSALIRLRRAVFVLLFSIVAMVGLVPAGTASAATGCGGGTSVLLGAVIAQCQSGTYASAGRCRNWLGYQAYVQGPRRSAPYTSIGYCPGGYWPIQGWVLTYS
jgi:hypothetical protein